MRCPSIRAQMSESIPLATIENFFAVTARSDKRRSRARAAASNAGPKFADVAGRLKLNSRISERASHNLVYLASCTFLPLAPNAFLHLATKRTTEHKGQLSFPPSAKARSRRRHWVLRTRASAAASSIVHSPRPGRSPRTDL